MAGGLLHGSLGCKRGERSSRDSSGEGRVNSIRDRAGRLEQPTRLFFEVVVQQFRNRPADMPPPKKRKQQRNGHECNQADASSERPCPRSLGLGEGNDYLNGNVMHQRGTKSRHHDKRAKTPSTAGLVCSGLLCSALLTRASTGPRSRRCVRRGVHRGTVLVLLLLLVLLVPQVLLVLLARAGLARPWPVPGGSMLMAGCWAAR